MDKAFEEMFTYKFLPIYPIWLVLGLEYSAWFFLMMPVGVVLAWFRSRKHRQHQGDLGN